MVTVTQQRFLKRLLLSDSSGLPDSDVPKSSRSLVEQLQRCGCIQRQQLTRGAKYVLCDRELLIEFIAREAPAGLNDGPLPESRADAIAQYRDSKVSRVSKRLGVFVRTSRDNVILESERGRIDISALSEVAGGAAVMLGNGISWRLSGSSVALIENAEAFWNHDVVLPHVDLAVWTVGRMCGKRLLKWLASPEMSHCRYIHWGDYDPVGIEEYVRVAQACPGRSELWVPSNLETLFQRFGNRPLLTREGNTRSYKRLLKCRDDPTVARMMQLFDTYGSGLEQEILLLQI